MIYVRIQVYTVATANVRASKSANALACGIVRFGLDSSVPPAGPPALVEFARARALTATRVAGGPCAVMADRLSMFNAVGDREERNNRQRPWTALARELGSDAIAFRGRVRSRRLWQRSTALFQLFPSLHSLASSLE